MNKKESTTPLADAVASRWKRFPVTYYYLKTDLTFRMNGARKGAVSYMRNWEDGTFDDRSWEAKLDMLNYLERLVAETEFAVLGVTRSGWANKFAISLRLKELAQAKQELEQAQQGGSDESVANVEKKVEGLEKDIRDLQFSIVKRKSWSLDRVPNETRL